MKTVFKLATAFAIASMTFAACNKHEVETPQNEEDFFYTFSITNPETRSILASDENGKFGSWETGDQLGTGVNDATPGYSAIIPGSPVTFKIYKQGGLKENDAIYAYYPYNSSTESIDAVALEIPVSQNQNGSVFDFDAMPMAAESFIVPSDLESTTNQTNVVGQISFVNLGSVVDFQVFSSNEDYADETVLSIQFQANKAIAGVFEKNLTVIDFSDESTLAISGYSESDVTTTITDAPELGATRAAAAHVYMVIAPSTDVTGSVIVTTNKAKYTYSLSTAQTFKRAGLKSFGLNLGTCQNRVEETTVIPVIASYKMDDYFVANDKVNPLVLDEVVTLTTTAKGNSGKFFGSEPNRDWRLYETDGAFITVSVANGYELRGVQFNYNVSNSGTLLNAPSGEFIDVTGSSVTYTVGNTGTATNGQVRLTSVTVKYISSSSKETVPAPTNVTAEVDGNDINVEWTDANNSHIAYYLVTCTGQIDQQVEPGTEFAIFEDLSDGYYVVTVTAIPANSDNYNRSTTWTNEDNPIVIGTPFESVSFTYSRTSDNLTSGYELTVENGKLEATYIQDKNATTGLDLLFTKDNESALFSTKPNSISLTVKVGGGSTKDPLTNSVLAYLVDANGNNISSTQTIVTNKVETKDGKEYTVSLPLVSSAYGLRISHQKESSYNVRVFSVSFTAN